MRKLFFAVLIAGICSFAGADGEETAHAVNLKNPVSQKGTVSFILETDTTYSNGLPGSSFGQTLFELPGLGKCILEKSLYAVFVYFQWEQAETHNGFFIMFRELPGPQNYSFQFSWDAEKGLSESYMNGIPVRTENARYYKPWKVKGSTMQAAAEKGANRVTDLKVLPVFMNKEEAAKLVPAELLGKAAHLIGPKSFSNAKKITGKKGRLLYSAELNNESSVKDWILEGPGKIEFKDGQLMMSSQIPNPPDGSTGHFNFWCPESFPNKIMVEWEFKPLSEMGVCHLFFAAAGKNGENVFDESLPKRDGHFQQYINDQINNYYVIYFSNRRLYRTTNFAAAWLVKSANASLLTLGPAPVKPGGKRFHKMRLIKDGAHIQLLADGKVFLDYKDSDADRYGPALKSGMISFRQMAVTTAAYRNFEVWELQ